MDALIEIAKNKTENYILALPTIAVINDVVRRIQPTSTDKKCRSLGLHKVVEVINTKTVNGKVADALVNAITERKSRFIICTHEALGNMELDCKNWNLIIDEQPRPLIIKDITVNNIHYPVMDELVIEKDGFIIPAMPVDELQKHIDAKRSDELYSDRIVDFLELVKDSAENKPMTAIVQDDDGISKRTYAAATLSPLMTKMNNFKGVTVLTADDTQNGLFGLIAAQGFNLQKPKWSKKQKYASQKKINAIPLMTRASRNNYNKEIQDGKYKGKTYQEACIHHCLDNNVRLFMTNSHDRHQNLIKDIANKRGIEVDVMSPICHGQNGYSHHTKIGIIFTDRGTKATRKLLDMLENGTNPKEQRSDKLVNAYVQSYFYDIVYQAMCRTAVRDIQNEVVIDAYLPDVETVEYCLTRFHPQCKKDNDVVFDVEKSTGGFSKNTISELFGGDAKLRPFRDWADRNLDGYNPEDSRIQKYAELYYHGKSKSCKAELKREKAEAQF